MDIKEIKGRLDNKEIIELHNGNDIASLSKSNLTNDYLFIFNTKALFGFKTFKVFGRLAKEKIDQYGLVEFQD